MSNGGVRALLEALRGGRSRSRPQGAPTPEDLQQFYDLVPGVLDLDGPEGRAGRGPAATPPRAGCVAADRGSGGPAPRPGCLRKLGVTLVVTFLLVGGRVALPQVSGWVDYLVHGDPRFRVATGPSSVAPAADGRVRPAVPVPDAPAASHYSFLQTLPNGDPVTFDPCRPIHYVVRDAPGAGAAGRDAVTRAVADLSLATGLAFVDDGDTDEVPTDGRGLSVPRYGSRWAPVLIAWSDPTESPDLEGDTVGVGGGITLGRDGGHRTYVTGMVRLDTPALARHLGSSGGAAEAQAVIMHELAHVLGAGHAEDSGEIMAAATGADSLGEGDRYALAVLGQGKCVPGLG